jgi:hypothetical protein
MHVLDIQSVEEDRFAASCRELQASGLRSPESEIRMGFDNE